MSGCLAVPCGCAPCPSYLLQEHHLPVQAFEEGLLLHLLSAAGQCRVNAAVLPTVMLPVAPSPHLLGLTHAPCSPAAG